VQDNRVYDPDIFKFFHNKIDLNWFLNFEKIKVSLNIHCKYKYEMHHIYQMYIISNDLYMDYEKLFYDQLQLNVPHISFLNTVLRNNNVEKRYFINLLSIISMYILKFL